MLYFHDIDAVASSITELSFKAEQVILPLLVPQNDLQRRSAVSATIKDEFANALMPFLLQDSVFDVGLKENIVNRLLDGFGKSFNPHAHNDQHFGKWMIQAVENSGSTVLNDHIQNNPLFLLKMIDLWFNSASSWDMQCFLTKDERRLHDFLREYDNSELCKVIKSIWVYVGQDLQRMASDKYISETYGKNVVLSTDFEKNLLLLTRARPAEQKEAMASYQFLCKHYEIAQEFLDHQLFQHIQRTQSTVINFYDFLSEGSKIHQKDLREAVKHLQQNDTLYTPHVLRSLCEDIAQQAQRFLTTIENNVKKTPDLVVGSAPDNTQQDLSSDQVSTAEIVGQTTEEQQSIALSPAPVVLGENIERYRQRTANSVSETHISDQNTPPQYSRVVRS